MARKKRKPVYASGSIRVTGRVLRCDKCGRLPWTSGIKEGERCTTPECGGLYGVAPIPKDD